MKMRLGQVALWGYNIFYGLKGTPVKPLKPWAGSCSNKQQRIGVSRPSYFFIPLVLGLLNSLTEGASPRKSMAPTKLRLRECTFSVVVTE